MKRALALCLLGLALPAAHAAAQHGAGPGGHGGDGGDAGARVSIGFDSVSPQRLDVLTGDAVTWTNDSVRVHTVTADDGAFDSGRMPGDARFSRRFEVPGEHAYHCMLHPTIRGVVGVHPLLLATPAQAAAPRRPFPLAGRAALPAGTAVAIEADHGAGFAPIATTAVDPDGAFVAPVVPQSTATYRAVAAGLVSPPVRLLVLDRRIAVTTQRGRHRVLVRAHVAPAAPGATVVLQLFLRERFGWWPVQRGRLDRRSRATFALRTRRRVAARVLLTLPDGATRLAISRTVRVGPAR